MALDTYSALQTAIVEYAMRQGDTEFIARVPTFIEFAEKRMGEELRLGSQETAATVTLTSGSGTLPTGYLAMIRCVANSSPVRVLQQVSLQEALERYPTSPSGVPDLYTISGTTITVYPSTAATLSIVYYAAIPALSDASPSNWLLTRAPQLYLYGSLIEAAPYMEDDTRAQVWGTMFQKGMEALVTSDLVARSGQKQSHVRFPTP